MFKDTKQVDLFTNWANSNEIIICFEIVSQ